MNFWLYSGAISLGKVDLVNSKRTFLNARRSSSSSRDAIWRISSDGRSDSVNAVMIVSSARELVAGSLRPP